MLQLEAQFYSKIKTFPPVKPSWIWKLDSNRDLDGAPGQPDTNQPIQFKDFVPTHHEQTHREGSTPSRQQETKHPF